MGSVMLCCCPWMVLLLDCGTTDRPDGAVAAKVGSAVINEHEVDQAVARLGGSRCDALRATVREALLQQVCGHGHEGGACVQAFRPADAEVDAERRALQDRSPSIAGRMRRRDAFLRGFAADRLTKRRIDAELSTAAAKIPIWVADSRCSTEVAR